MKKVSRPDYEILKQSIISSIKTNYDMYKKSLKKYLDLTWYGEDGALCMMEGADKYIRESNVYLGKVSGDKRLLELCNTVIAEDKDWHAYTENELQLLKEYGYI